MSLPLGAIAPGFIAESTEGPIRFHDWIDGNWCVLFSHPKDFTPVCTTELGAVARAMPAFEQRGVKVIGLSVDPIDSHRRWTADIEETQAVRLSYPLIADPHLAVAQLYRMLPASANGAAKERTAADNHTARSLFVIGPDKVIKLVITYPMSTGRNFDEVLRVIDSLQLTAGHKVATPANWQQGEKVIILPSVGEEDARRAFPQGWEAPRPYMRFVDQPA
ncbi:MAG: peroxiredoxin [Pseudomonadota bacterium]